MDTVIVVEFGPKNVVEYVEIQRPRNRRRYITRGYDNVTKASAQRLANVCKSFTNRTMEQSSPFTTRHTITA